MKTKQPTHRQILAAKKIDLTVWPERSPVKIIVPPVQAGTPAEPYTIAAAMLRKHTHLFSPSGNDPAKKFLYAMSKAVAKRTLTDKEAKGVIKAIKTLRGDV